MVGDEHRRRARARRDPGPSPRRSQRWRHGLTGAPGESPRPEDGPLLDLAALRAAWEREWAGYDAWFDVDGARLARPGGGRRQPVAGARPRRQPRHPAPVRGGRPADRRGPLARATSTWSTTRNRRGAGRHMSRLMDLVAGEAPTILHGHRARRPRGPRRPVALHRPPRARERPRPDLARPLRRGGPDGDRRATSRATSSTPGSSSTDPATAKVAPSSGSTRPGSRRSPGSRTTTSTPSPDAGSSSSRTSSASCRARRSPGSATSPAASSPSAARRTGRPTSSSPGRFGEPTRRRTSTRRSRPTESLWDAWTAIHAAGEFYDLEGFKAGGVRLRPYEIEMIGDVAGKTLLHLQCHFGIDTLSWARLGARVTGADLSPAAIELARSLADELGFPDARFVQLEPVRPAGRARRPVRRRLHLARRARLAARTSAAGHGSSPISWPRAGRSSSPRPTRS